MVLASVFALRWARPLLVPIRLGMLISYALEPMVQRLGHWRVPHSAAASLVFIGMLAMIGVLSYAISFQLAAVADRLPSAAQELREALQACGHGAPGPVGKVQEAAKELEKISGADAPVVGTPKIPTVAIEKKPFDLGDYLWEGSLSVTTFIGDSDLPACWRGPPWRWPRWPQPWRRMDARTAAIEARSMMAEGFRRRTGVAGRRRSNKTVCVTARRYAGKLWMAPKLYQRWASAKPWLNGPGLDMQTTTVGTSCRRIGRSRAVAVNERVCWAR